MEYIHINKHIERIDILLTQLQSKFSSLVVNVTRRADVVTIECVEILTETQRKEIENITLSFDSTLYEKIERERPVTLLSSPKDYEKMNFWTVICLWKFQGTYVETLQRIEFSYVFNSNSIDNTFGIRVYDGTNNVIIQSLNITTKGESQNSLEEESIIIDSSILPYLPSTLEIHLSMSSPKDVLNIKNITAIYMA